MVQLNFKCGFSDLYHAELWKLLHVVPSVSLSGLIYFLELRSYIVNIPNCYTELEGSPATAGH